MGYCALTAFLSTPIAEPEDIPEAEKTPEYWAARLGREWHGLPADVLAEKLLPFFREFNRLCEAEKGRKL